MKRKKLWLDIETYSETDLNRAGVYRYAEDPSFEVLLLAYAFDDDPVQVIDMTAIDPPASVLEAITDPAVAKCAWNANFERTGLKRRSGLPMPPEQWEDTMITAAELGLPMSLANAGKVLGLSENKLKMQEGKNLIQYFSKPCRPTKANDGRTRNLPEHDPDRWEKYKVYNKRDVETEREIARLLNGYKIDKDEKKLWCIDQDINDRGVMIDRNLAENAARIDRESKDALKEEARQISGLENPNSVIQIKNWIRERAGETVESLDKRVIGDVRKKLKSYQDISRFLQIRSQLAVTSTAKYSRMLECVGEDGRIRGLSQFYGAARTGRWSGRNVQLQNLKQNKMPDEDLDLARRIVADGDTQTLGLLYDPARALSELIRTAFVPAPGHKFIVSDFSAIEARVLAWIAGEDWRLDVFNGDGKIYEASAEKMFNLEPGSVKKGDPMRQKGKIAELALGYGGSVGALRAMGALEMGLQENELKPLVDSWRAANRNITNLWWTVDKAAKNCVKYGDRRAIKGGGWNVKSRWAVYHCGIYEGETFAVSEDQAINNVRFRNDLLYSEMANFYASKIYEGPRLAVRMDGMLMRILLPSGREISYAKPKIEGDTLSYEGQIQAGGWGRIETYGPKLVENIIQATSRDCLAESMKRLEEAGVPIVFHVHDEVICEVPEDAYSAEDIAQIMSKAIEWAPGLPMKADAYECHYYRKD